MRAIDINHPSVIPEPNSGCWIWLGAENLGYGRVYFGKRSKRRSKMAHRMSYELVRGQIPDGLVIDHLCRNTYCVNPDHLEAVTDAINIRRGLTGINNRSKTHCPKGHPYDEQNTGRVFAKGVWNRFCRACRRGDK